MFNVNPNTRIGVAYRSSMKYTIEGNVTFANRPALLAAAIPDGSVTADIKLPATASLSLFHRLNPQWDLLADVSWTEWSTIQTLNIVRTSGVRVSRRSRSTGRTAGVWASAPIITSTVHGPCVSASLTIKPRCRTPTGRLAFRMRTARGLLSGRSTGCPGRLRSMSATRIFLWGCEHEPVQSRSGSSESAGVRGQEQSCRQLQQQREYPQRPVALRVLQGI